MMQASNVQAKLADVANFQINLLKVKLSTQCTAAYSLARSLARGDDSPNRIPLLAWQQRISPPLRASCFVLRSDRPRPTEETDEASSSPSYVRTEGFHKARSKMSSLRTSLSRLCPFDRGPVPRKGSRHRI